MDKSYFEISEEIKIALKDKKPVVARKYIDKSWPTISNKFKCC